MRHSVYITIIYARANNIRNQCRSLTANKIIIKGISSVPCSQMYHPDSLAVCTRSQIPLQKYFYSDYFQQTVLKVSVKLTMVEKTSNVQYNAQKYTTGL